MGRVVEDSRRDRFEQLHRCHARALLGYALRRVGRSEDAVDVLADTMLVAWRRIDDVPPGDDARLWLFGVARRVLANHRRSALRRSRLGDRLREDLADQFGTDLAVTTETSLVLTAAVAQLGEGDREILRLTTWEGFDPHEIAVVLTMPAGTVRTRLHRARRRLREQLQAMGWDDDAGERFEPVGHVGHDERPLVRDTEDET